MPAATRNFLYLVYGLIVAGLVTVIVLAFHSGSSKPTPAKPNSSHQVAQAPSKPQSASRSNSQRSNQTSNSGQSSAGTSSSKLSNSGPGDTVGLFVLASLAGTVAYHWRLVRRIN